MTLDIKREFHITEWEAEVLDAACGAAGISRSAYLRGALIARLLNDGWGHHLFPALSVRELIELYPNKTPQEIAGMVEHLRVGVDTKEQHNRVGIDFSNVEEEQES
jgi:hypothetical protein